jgi:hypothetical protein
VCFLLGIVTVFTVCWTPFMVKSQLQNHWLQSPINNILDYGSLHINWCVNS